jgi:hypothetical protein
MFTVSFRSGCPHTFEKWSDPMAFGNRTVFAFDCSAAWGWIHSVVDRKPQFPPIHPFGQFILHRGFVPIESRQWVEQWSYTPQGLCRILRAREHTLDLHDFVSSLPGFVTVRTLADAHGAIFRYHGKGLISISWIPPWAVSLYSVVQSLQLDASFAPSHPFVYSVPLGILYNEAAPLGLIINVTEDSGTYQWFWDDLNASTVPLRQLIAKPVLSDQGTALKEVCRAIHASHFFCHCHLIRNFGADGPLGLIAADALREKSIQSYSEHRPQYLADAKALLDEKVIDQDAYKKICDFLSEDFPHGIWHRMIFGISTCSNHAERFHGVVNQHINGHTALPVRLSVIRDLIYKKYDDFRSRTRHPEQLRELFKQLEGYHARQAPSCKGPGCAEFIQMMRTRYGLNDFPCRHTIRQEKWKSLLKVPPPYAFTHSPEHIVRELEVTRTRPLPHRFVPTPNRDPEPDSPSEIPGSTDQPDPDPPWDETAEWTPESVEVDVSVAETMRRWERADRDVVHRIVNGIIRLSSSATTGEKRTDLALAVYADLQRATTSSPDSERVAIAAQCKVHWWKWAKFGGPRPMDAHGWSPRPTSG